MPERAQGMLPARARAGILQVFVGALVAAGSLSGDASVVPGPHVPNVELAPSAKVLPTPFHARLRGGGEQYDSTKAQTYDQVLWDILDKHPDEIYFLNTVFNFLQRRTPCFNGRNAERNYNILIDTLSRQRDQYVQHVSKGTKMKPPQPMNATQGSGPRASTKKEKPKQPAAPAPPPPVDSAPQMPKADNYQEVDLTKRHETASPKGVQTPINNGGRTDKYIWTQTLHEVSVEVFLPQGVVAKQLDVRFSANHLYVAVKGADAPIIDGKLDEGIKPAECYWTVEDDVLQLGLVKSGEMCWWQRVIKGDARIDVKKIEPENSNLSDLNPELRQTVEKMMYDQQQKAMGKPTSDEVKNKDMLKNFMAQHPEMDFSNCKFNG